MNSLQVSRVIAADAETLFQTWTDPNLLRNWWRQEGEGWAFAGASIDLRVGGRYRVAMTAPDGRRHVAAGVYREVQRPLRLVFTWDWEEPSPRVGQTLVTVEFKSIGDRRTEVTVRHEGFADITKPGRHEHGWTQLLSLLQGFIDSKAIAVSISEETI